MSANKSKIEWTETTWNPVTGCDRVSNGCQHCYAERLAHRLQAMGSPRYRNGFRLTIHRDLFDVPLRWKRPRMIFVNSMSDLFHEQIPDDDIRRIFDAMQKAHWHTFQVLTKRPTRMKQLAPRLPWPPNVWMGVTVESGRYAHRIEALRTIPAAIRFVSFEPLIGPVSVLTDLSGVDWAIVGGESGPGARKMEYGWVADIRNMCRSRGIAFFFKQWGGVHKAAAGRVLDGRTWDEMPAGFGAPTEAKN